MSSGVDFAVLRLDHPMNLHGILSFHAKEAKQDDVEYKQKYRDNGWYDALLTMTCLIAGLRPLPTPSARSFSAHYHPTCKQRDREGESQYG